MNWKDLRATLAWTMILLLGALVGGGVYVTHLMSQADRMVERLVREKLDVLAPEWFIDFEGMKFDPAGHLQLEQVVMRPRNSAHQVNFFEAAFAQIDLDPELLNENQQVVIRHVHLREPRWVIFRDHTGHWSYQDAAPPVNESGLSARITVEQGYVLIGLQQALGAPVTEVVVQDINTTLIPAAHRRYRTNGRCNVSGLGTLNVQLLADGNTGEWNITGETDALQISDNMLASIAAVIPGGSDQIARIGISPVPQHPDGPSFNGSRDPFRLASTTNELVPAQPVATSTPVPAIRADAQVSFSAGQTQRNAPLDYSCKAKIQRGQLSKAVTPLPLYDLTAEFEFSPQLLVIRQLSAANGTSKLYIDGELRQVEGVWRKGFVIRATQLELDERVRRFLPAKVLELHNQLQPSGQFDLAMTLGSDGIGTPSIECEFTAIDCAARFAQLPYPIHKVRGTVRKEGQLYRVDLNGLAGDRPVSLAGYVIPGDNLTDSKLTVTATDIPIDDRLLASLQTPELEAARKTIESLNLTGRADVTAVFIRRPGIDQKYRVQLNTEVREGTIRFENFPIPLTSFSGRMTYDAMKRDAFVFTNLEARHGDALIRAEGVFDKATAPGMLALQMELLNVPIDSDVRRATTLANPGLETIWTDYGLGGDVDVDRVEIGWIPGGKAVVSLYGMQWKNGRLKPKVLPYGWENIAGALQWVDNRLTIHSLHGWHGDTYLHIDGSTNGASAYIETSVSPDLNWHVHVDSLQFVKLTASEDLRRALPESIRKVIESINISGPMDLQLGLDLKGWDANDLVTAEWSSLLVLAGNKLTAGLDMNDVTGKVQMLRGTWNGQQATADGYVELDYAKVIDLPLSNIKGPFRIEGDEVLVGARGEGTASPYLESNRYRDKKLTADFFSGRIGLQSTILMAQEDLERMQYRVDLKVEDAELAEFAKYRGVQEQRLAGKVNGEVSCTGLGTSRTKTRGEGWINITPAQLFELPVFAQMFSLIKFREPDDTFFNYAYGDFALHDGLIDFSKIELYGKSLNLGGRGFVGYAGPNESKLALDFYTHGQRSLFQPLTDRWMRIQVGGTVSNPQPFIQPRIPVLNDALDGFMRAVDNGQRPPPPRQRPSTQVPIAPNAARPVEPK